LKTLTALHFNGITNDWTILLLFSILCVLFSLTPLHLNNKAQLKARTIDPAKTWNNYAWCHQGLFYDILISKNNNIISIKIVMERNFTPFYSRIQRGVHGV
jgi:hypothetical protein